MKLLIFTILLFFYSNVYAQWILKTEVDNFTDEKVTHLSFDSNNFIIYIEHKKGLPWITIKRKNFSSIDLKTNIEIRIDKNKLYNGEIGFMHNVYETNRTNYNDRNVFLDNKMIIFSLLNLSYFEKDFLCDIANGNYLYIRYNLMSGYKESLKIPLKNIKEKIKILFGSKVISECH